MEHVDLQSSEQEKPTIDVTEQFFEMRPWEFKDFLRQYRKKEVNLQVHVKWNGNRHLANKLKAFIEGADGDEQERSAGIIGSEEQKNEALELGAANALNSGVKWLEPENESDEAAALDEKA